MIAGMDLSSVNLISVYHLALLTINLKD